MASLHVIAKWATMLLTTPASDEEPLRKEVTDAVRSAEAAGVNLSDLAEEAYHFGRGLAGVVARAEDRLRQLEKKVNGAGYANDVAPFVRDAERITCSMKSQLAALQQLCRNVGTPQFLEVRKVLDAKLEVPEFGRELLGGSSGKWIRPPEAWEPILDVMLRRAEYRVEYRRMERSLELPNQ